MPRQKFVTPAQLSKLYRPEWGKARKVLIRAGYSDEEAEEKRFEIHEAITGSACSSKAIPRNMLDRVLKAFAAISEPNNGTRQADLADADCKRLRFVIGETAKRLGYDDGKVESLSIRMTRRSLIQCDEGQLLTILQALKIHENRDTQKPDQA